MRGKLWDKGAQRKQHSPIPIGERKATGQRLFGIELEWSEGNVVREDEGTYREVRDGAPQMHLEKQAFRLHAVHAL